MTLDQVRKFALSLPKTTEAPHFDATSFRVGKIFVTAPPHGDYINVFVDEHETKACVAEDPNVFEEVWWGNKLAGVRIYLKRAKPARVKELVTEAWLLKAPKRVATQLHQ